MEKDEGLLKRIRKIEETTTAEEKILRFFESTYPMTAFETIHSISEKCGVGKSTVTRFVIRLGYESFSDFMNSLKMEVSSQIESPLQRFTSFKDSSPREAHEHFDRYADFALNSITKTRNRMNGPDFEKAVSLLSNTKGTLYIAGSATSYGLAYFFYMLATYMRSRVVLLESSPAGLSHALIDVTPDDILLGILHYRFSTQTVKAVEWFAEKKAKVVLISDREKTPVSRLAEVQLFSSSAGQEMFNSRISTLMILESLLASMAPRLEKEVYQRFEIFDELRDKFATFAVPSASGPDGSALYESKKTNESGEFDEAE